MNPTHFRWLPEALEPDGVHVWIVALDGPPPRPADDCLSPAEHERMQRLTQPERRRYAATRTAVRRILSRYAGRDAASLELQRSGRGKPALRDADVHFSLSHSAGLALIAVSRRLLGVDVEHMREPRRLERTAARILHPQTVELLSGLPPGDRVTAFLDAWTQREAHVKAVGGGLFHTPDTLPFIPAAADGAPFLLHDRQTGEPWTVARFQPVANTRASVVVRGDTAALHYALYEEGAERT